jgi:hypothetical protein
VFARHNIISGRLFDCHFRSRMFADPIGRVTGPGGSLLLSSVFSDFTPGHHALAPPLWTLRWRRARLGVETKAC